MPNPRLAPIGVFDSGIGGLTVAAALRRELPAESILYIGDTARVPYGGKSQPTIQRYALEIGAYLAAQGAKCLVVACNTASALALEALRTRLPIPVLGVVEPGARAAVETAGQKPIAVLGTRSTIASGAYERAIHCLQPQANILSIACPLLVPLIEEGLFDDPLMDMALARYLAPLREFQPKAIVLGCTHYPLAAAAISRAAPPQAVLVDSAHHCALATRQLLQSHDLLAPDSLQGHLEAAFTDPAENFLRIAAEALKLPVEKPKMVKIPSLFISEK